MKNVAVTIYQHYVITVKSKTKTMIAQCRCDYKQK